MTLSTTPSPARTDVLAIPKATVSGMSAQTIRRIGFGLAAGTVSWAAASAAWGFDTTSGVGIVAQDLTGFLFQVGVMGLLHVQMATRATGTKRINLRLLKVERVLLGIAMLWSILHAVLPSQRDAAWLVALDLFWPLSMLGMFFIGVKVVFTRRWRGPARAWSLLAETWAVATVPVMAIFGPTAGTVAGAAHLLLGYTVLGLILATRPELVEDRG